MSPTIIYMYLYLYHINDKCTTILSNFECRTVPTSFRCRWNALQERWSWAYLVLLISPCTRATSSLSNGKFQWFLIWWFTDAKLGKTWLWLHFFRKLRYATLLWSFRTQFIKIRPIHKMGPTIQYLQFFHLENTQVYDKLYSDPFHIKIDIKG